MMRKLLMTILLLAVVTAVIPVSLNAAEGGTAFKDVPSSHWAASTISTAVNRGIVKGYPDGTFRPSNTITRAEVATMLSRVTKLSPDTFSSAFRDLDKHWSKDDVRKLVALGFISTGDYAKGFDPNREITRYELMKWMATGLSESEPSFKQALADTKATLLPTPESFTGGITPEQVPYIALARGAGIVNGFPDGTFKPGEKATRAEVLAMMLRYAQVEGTKAESYRDLQEMIGVSLEGTNMSQITDMTHLKNTLSFKELREQVISFPSMDVQINRIIFVDGRQSLRNGIYTLIFHKSQEHDFVGYTYANIEVTITLKTDNFNYLKLDQELGKKTNFLQLEHYSDEVKNKSLFPVLPRSSAKEYLSKGKSVRVWLPTVFKAGEGQYIITDKGDFRIH